VTKNLMLSSDLAMVSSGVPSIKWPRGPRP
jgi:hypothetical protein